MSAIRVFLVLLVSLVRARQLDDRLDEELRSHVEFAVEENLARGMTPDAARAAAIRSVGGMLRTRETWREVRGFPALTALWQDLRYAVRSYRKTPAFTIIALLSLTLAIGANVAIFSLLNALVLRRLPVRDPRSLVQVTTVKRVRGRKVSPTPKPHPALSGFRMLRLQRHQPSCRSSRERLGSTSSILALTIFFISRIGNGLSIGNCTVPLDVLNSSSWSLNGSTASSMANTSPSPTRSRRL